MMNELAHLLHLLLKRTHFCMHLIIKFGCISIHCAVVYGFSPATPCTIENALKEMNENEADFKQNRIEILKSRIK